MSHRKAKGFTVFELMITVAIAAVLAAFAIPSFMDMMARNRINSMSEEMVNSLNTARNTAISRRRTVVLAPDATGWSIRLDSTVGQMLVRQRFDDRVLVTYTTTAPAIVFRPSGGVIRPDVLLPADNRFATTITLCDNESRREVGKNLAISAIGRIRTQAHANASVCNP